VSTHTHTYAHMFRKITCYMSICYMREKIIT
jgi:hypothetical protein